MVYYTKYIGIQLSMSITEKQTLSQEMNINSATEQTMNNTGPSSANYSKFNS